MVEQHSFGADNNLISVNKTAIKQFINEGAVELTRMGYAYHGATDYPENVFKQAREISARLPKTELKKHLEGCPCCRAKALFVHKELHAALETESDLDFQRARLHEALVIISVENHLKFFS